MVHRQFLAALEKFDVKPFSAVGGAFDPQFHAAVAAGAVGQAGGDGGSRSLQRGYTMGARAAATGDGRGGHRAAAAGRRGRQRG